MAYLARLALFGVCPYATLCALAVFFGWLPMSNPGAWATFTVVYLAILAVLILVFNARLSRKTRELNGGGLPSIARAGSWNEAVVEIYRMSIISHYSASTCPHTGYPEIAKRKVLNLSM